MKTVKIVPSLCKQEGSQWEGHVIMRLPSFDEKMEYFEELGEEIDASGELAIGVKETTSSRAKKIRKMVSISEKHYQEVYLKNKSTGEIVNSLEELKYVADLHPVLVEFAGKLAEGFKVGNG